LVTTRKYATLTLSTFYHNTAPDMGLAVRSGGPANWKELGMEESTIRDKLRTFSLRLVLVI
jgi:hypothetical protein